MVLGVQGHTKPLWPADFTRDTKIIWGKEESHQQMMQKQLDGHTQGWSWTPISINHPPS